MTPAPVALKFVKEDGTTVERLVDLAPMSQQVVHVDDIPGLEAGAMWTAVQSTADVVVERTMFWDSNRYGGHGTGGIPGASTRWYFADGAQGSVASIPSSFTTLLPRHVPFAHELVRLPPAIWTPG